MVIQSKLYKKARTWIQISQYGTMSTNKENVCMNTTQDFPLWQKARKMKIFSVTEQS